MIDRCEGELKGSVDLCKECQLPESRGRIGRAHQRLADQNTLHTELAEGNRFESLLPLLDGLPAHSVLCSHGDLIPALIDALAWRGMHVSGEPDWRKGSMWVIDRDGDEFVRAVAVPPPS